MKYFPASLSLLAFVAYLCDHFSHNYDKLLDLDVTCQIFITPPTLINNQGHELEEAFIVHALACLEIHGQINH